MKSILLITHEYPLKQGDATFIESEMPYLSKAFDTVHVLCLGRHTGQGETLGVPQNVHVNFVGWKRSSIVKCALLFAVVFSPIFYKELVTLAKAKRLSLVTLRCAVGFLYNALFLQTPVKRILKSDTNICLIYTYWYVQETLGALLLRKRFGNVTCITRAHGYDVHEFRNRAGYLPFKLWMDRNISKVFFASQALHDYYLCKFARCVLDKYVTMRLGIRNEFFEGRQVPVKDLSIFYLCSCSNIIPIKRIHLIINALGQISDARIHWTHIGDGSDGQNIRAMADSILGSKPNISHEFKGLMTSEQIMRFYCENHIDCFISTTEAEGGCPVSISEAISFGIPVIATAVGGIPEIVKEDFGTLLNPSGDITEISDAITGFCNLREERRTAMRHSARKFWEANFNAETNHARFSKELLALVGEGN